MSLFYNKQPFGVPPALLQQTNMDQWPGDRYYPHPRSSHGYSMIYATPGGY
jgi:hypothetical protein